MDQFQYDLKIPKERVAVLIGKDGEVKKKIEEETGCDLDIDSKEGEVLVKGTDAIKLFSLREIIQAIGRGFNPETALLLLKADYMFELVQIGDFAKTKNDMVRLKGRVIGQEGKSRKIIEDLTGAQITIYGKTIGIIGEAQEAVTAKRAIVSLLQGSTHAKVYKWLEKQQREMRKGMVVTDDDIKKDDDEKGETTESTETESKE